MTMEILPATAERFDSVAAILAPRRPDAPACWCLAYRTTSAENHALTGEDRPGHLRSLCEQDIAPGLIAFVDGEPAGWCSFGPREEMGRLRRSRTIQRIDDRPVWSVVCFVVKADFRRQGVAHRLLEATIDYARSHGVETLEGYPVDPAGARVSANMAFVGTTSLFEAAGFERIALTTAKSGGLPRWIVRKELTSRSI